MKNINWGIIGCGHIAHQFVTSLRALNQGTLLACASRTPKRAQSFAETHAIKYAYNTYEEMVNDPNIDAIYIATTHNFHAENIKLCLEHNKHVLCEKPFTINTSQAKELINLAKTKNLFVMEALWTRFLPAIQHLKSLLDDNIIGTIHAVHANFSINKEFDESNRLRNKALGGGALLDLGIYPITFAAIVFGSKPTRIQSSAFMGDTNVDERSYYLLDYENGKHALLSSSYTYAAPTEGTIYGSKGFIRIPDFLAAKEIHIHRQNQPPQIINKPFDQGHNFKFEIAEAMSCISEERIESPTMPHTETIAILQIMDTIRDQWNLKYPDE